MDSLWIQIWDCKALWNLRSYGLRCLWNSSSS